MVKAVVYKRARNNSYARLTDSPFQEIRVAGNHLPGKVINVKYDKKSSETTSVRKDVSALWKVV